MRRAHRAVHRAVWPLLTLGLGAALVLALALRPAPDTAAAESGDFTVIEVLE